MPRRIRRRRREKLWDELRFDLARYLSLAADLFFFFLLYFSGVRDYRDRVCSTCFLNKYDIHYLVGIGGVFVMYQDRNSYLA